MSNQGLAGTQKTLDQIAESAPDYKRKYEEAIHFIEMTEALTYDERTAKRISDYLIREGIWQPIPHKS